MAEGDSPATRAGLHAWLNALPPEKARAALASCCGSTRWTAAMLARRPFASTAELLVAAEAIWTALDASDHLEAFSHHPAIGARVAATGAAGDRDGASDARAFSAREQAQVAHAGAATLQALETLNRAYRDRFGFVFLICATGKSADEMLGLLRARIDNPVETELRIAAGEQAKITRLRLEALTR